MKAKHIVRATLAPTLSAFALGAVPGVALADPVFPTMNNAGGVFWRAQPDWNTPIAQSGYGHYPGTNVRAMCFVPGSTVPGSSNTMWLRASWVSGPGRGSGFINEHMVNDGAPINQAASGVPPCSGGPPPPPPTPPPPPPPGSGNTVVWIGAPAGGTWPTASECAGASYPSASCALPSVHHTPWGGDWAYDQQNIGAGTSVNLYAAPQNTAYNNQISARVEAVGLACLPGSGESAASTASRGGYAVKIAIYHASARVGTVTYAHVNPTVRAGQAVGRWGSRIGTVGSYVTNRCWDGVHTHIELYNEHNYACFNRTFSPGQRMNATNFIGFLGGSYAGRPRQPCP